MWSDFSLKTLSAGKKRTAYSPNKEKTEMVQKYSEKATSPKNQKKGRIKNEKGRTGTVCCNTVLIEEPSRWTHRSFLRPSFFLTDTVTVWFYSQIVVAYPRPAFSATKRTNHALINFDQQVRVSQGYTWYINKKNGNTEVHCGGGLELVKPAREPASNRPKPCALLKKPYESCPWPS